MVEVSYEIRVRLIVEADQFHAPADSGDQLEFRRHPIKERQHQTDATISHQNHIYALDRLLARSSIAPCVFR
jgi:hypothetical protein